MVRRWVLLLAWGLAACAGGGPPVDETELEGRCGDGAVVYLEWTCGPGGWTMERVGEREWSCAAPHAGALVGRTAACRVATLRACGGDAAGESAACDTTRQCATPPPNEPCEYGRAIR